MLNIKNKNLAQTKVEHQKNIKHLPESLNVRVKQPNTFQSMPMITPKTQNPSNFPKTQNANQNDNNQENNLQCGFEELQPFLWSTNLVPDEIITTP